MAGHSIRATGAQNPRGRHNRNHGELGTKTAFLVLTLSIIAVASVVWQLFTLMENGISEPVSIADLTGFASAALTGIALLDAVLWQLLSLHIGLVALLGICLVLLFSKLSDHF